MEKYTRWRDAGTGLQPFLPVAEGQSDSGGSLIATASAVLRAPLALAALLLWSLLTVVLSWAPRTIICHVNSCIGRVALLLVCGTRAPPRAMQPRHGGEGFVASRDTADAALPRAGAVVVCNHQSPVDILWAMAHMSPALVVMPVLASAAPDAAAALVAMPPLAAALLCGRVLRADSKCPFWRVLRMAVVRDVQDLETASALGRSIGGPILVPLEGTTTNGRGILRPLDNVHGDVPVDAHAIAISHGPLGPGAATPLAGSLVRHLLWDCPLRAARLGGVLAVRWLSPAVVSSLLDARLPSERSKGDISLLAETISSLLSPRRPVLGLTMRDKAAFVAAYRAV